MPQPARSTSPTSAAWAIGHLPPFPVFVGGAVVALLLSTQFLFQPFVWRNWPWDEVMVGWFEVARDHVVVALAIALAVVAANHVPARTLRSRSIVLAIAILTGALAGELVLLASGTLGAPRDLAAMLGRAARWGLVAGSVATIGYLWRRAAETSAAGRAIELRRVQLERQSSQARLGALRSQIEPHFLFNTLATVRRLQEVQPEQGGRLLKYFVDYLRSVQPGRRNEDEIATLGQEIDLTTAYLGVVAVRMAGRLQVKIEMATELRDQPFPPLTIATLVENAVKHGIGPAIGGGAIAVSVRRVGSRLEAVVSDTGVGFSSGSGSSGSGIGLANIRARLRTLYGDAGTLALQANLPSGVRATMSLPFTRREVAA